MKMTDKKTVFARAASCVLLLFACFYMYDFYKCLSGFIANGFREPHVMLPMILSFFLPVFCFFVFFYDSYVKELRPITKNVYSVLFALWAAVDLAFIISEFELYASNNALGVYDTLPSIILHFPYDMLVLLPLIFLWKIADIAVFSRNKTRAKAFFDGTKERGKVHLALIEYIALCILGVFALVFTASAMCAAFCAFENAFYDVRFVLLIVFVMIIPLANIIVLALKPERMNIKKGAKLTALGLLIGTNSVFGLLFLAAELTYPDFVVHIGKPLFPITFSVSLPVELVIIFATMLLGTVFATVRLIKVARK
ncbi:MAG: hypothetical protein II329_04455 [Clostridia bacterium]|nr:hypothetical protein [Clostridia bacterium]